eukprot:354448-Chlamydomonas_euryale.AAC.11
MWGRRPAGARRRGRHPRPLTSARGVDSESWGVMIRAWVYPPGVAPARSGGMARQLAGGAWHVWQRQQCLLAWGEWHVWRNQQAGTRRVARHKTSCEAQDKLRGTRQSALHKTSCEAQGGRVAGPGFARLAAGRAHQTAALALFVRKAATQAGCVVPGGHEAGRPAGHTSHPPGAHEAGRPAGHTSHPPGGHEAGRPAGHTSHPP